MRTFDEMVNGPKQETRTFSDMAKSTYQGKGKRVGTKGNYRYIYDDKKSKPSNKKEGMFSKLFGGMKKLFGKKPTPSSREKLEKLATDKGMLSSIAKLTDLKALLGLRDMLLAHGAEEKKPRAAEPSEPVESEDNFDTMPEADPEPKERKERKTNPLNKLLALVNKRIGQLEAEKPEKKDEPKSVRIYKEEGELENRLKDFGAASNPGISIRIVPTSDGDKLTLEVTENGKRRMVNEYPSDVGNEGPIIRDALDLFEDHYQRTAGKPPKSEDNFDTMPESNAQGTQSTKDADAAHPEDRHEEVPDRKTRGLGEHNDKLSNIILDGKPLSDDTEFLDHLEVDDYPYGRQRTTAKFTIETDKQGRQRAVMQTVNPKTGRENKPKKATYSGSVKFFMHEGKTYVLEHSAEYGMVSISTVAGGFRNAMFETPDAKRPTNNISPNMGRRYASSEHPAGYMSLYEAATGKPAPKVQDFKDARKRMEDRREASVQRMQETNDRKAAVGLGISAGSSELEAREKAIAEGKASMVDGKYVEKPKSPAAQALEFVESNKPENRTKTAKDTVMKFLTENRRNQTAMVSLLGAYDDGGGYSLQLKQAKTGTLTAIVTRPDGSQSAKKLPTAISATAPQDIHKIALAHLSTVTEADNKKAATQAKDLAAAVAKFKAADSTTTERGFASSIDKHFSDRQEVEIQKAPSGHGKEAVSNKVQKYLETFTSKNDLRPNLRYVYHGDGESVATDGHRLVIVPTDNKLDESAKTLHPYQASKGLMVPNSKVRKEESVEGFGDSQDHKEYNENRAESMSFPNFSQVVPSDNIAHYADVKKLTAALDLAIANKKAGGATSGVRLTVSDSGELSVRLDPTLSDGKSVTGRREDMPTEMSLGSKAPGFRLNPKDHFVNAKYLKDALKNAGDGVVEIGLGTRELSPITVEHTNGIKHVIMPLRA